MLSHMSVLECRSVLGAGAGLTIDGRHYSELDLRSIASALTGSTVLHVANSEGFNVVDMKAIASAATAPAFVMFSGAG